MRQFLTDNSRRVPLGSALLLLLTPASALAVIDGVEATNFALTAKADHISTPDGGSVHTWGYALDDGRMQYPGVTMIVPQGETVVVTLRNALPAGAGSTSLVFAGQEVSASGGVQGLITREAPPDGTSVVTYTFVAENPGTFLYNSGTQSDLQVEMGLLGALIVRPLGFNAAAPTAYGHPDSAYDREVLFLLTEMDPRIHETVLFHGSDRLMMTDYLSDYFPNYWFINGRAAPDTMLPAGVGWLPTQPYNCMPRMHPGERLLMRVIGAGRDLHPFHHHGNNSTVIAENGRLLSSGPGAGADLAYSLFTIPSVPGHTTDAIFTWTGKKLGWDVYGTGPDFAHDCNDLDGDLADDVTAEWCPDHGKPLPVLLPEAQAMAFGGFYSGSPFLGTLSALPPGEGGMNPNAGFTYMWHSHAEKEMANYDIFPGGMMTLLVVEPHGTTIP